ncbi:MAG: glycosyltransferase [Varibaculum sp.]
MVGDRSEHGRFLGQPYRACITLAIIWNVCVDSLLRQTYANIQVILVDDGSTDGSADYAMRGPTRTPCVMVIHQANNGVSMARNAGINAAEEIGWSSWIRMTGLKREPSTDCLDWSATSMRRWPYSTTERIG